MQGIIIGGGIGGLATAVALRQQGIDVQVFEQTPEIREVGAGLVLSPNALQVLERLNLLETIRQQGWSLQKGIIADPNGTVVQTVDVDAMTRQYGYGMTVIKRGSLQKTLLEALTDGRVRTGKQLRNLQDTGQKVRATFTDGSSAEGDFLIGADGIRSVVRRQLMGEKPLRYSGQTCWRTIIDGHLPTDSERTSVEYWGKSSGLRVGFVPLGPDKIYTYVTARAAAGQHDQPGRASSLLVLGREFTPAVNRILAQADESRIFRADLYDLPTLTSWSQGKITLLGDAAHATTPNIGQGACQAIEDAWVVANCLSRHEPAQAFATYEALRKRKADRVVQISRQIGTAVNTPGWLKPLVFAAMRSIPKSFSARQFREIYQLTV
ncbi:FAD-dependent monooxygenase [Larkinella sp. VNQ87]|uniref:FAD-dependent monooxygenase n=1 Tax=Larkinella sp. VNQ87 TaxID=3400921 RepID=UPI003C124D40